ncbi:MAG TPA: sugar kinase [Gemmatimonadales bacterium]|nr:sugar kinase [Gemmatimonadales bacterium]
MTSLVTFGEAMVRLTPPGGAFQRLEQAHSFDVYVGGAELNVAALAARLGVASRWVSRLPDNALGRMIANRAREQGVDVHVEWAPEARAGLYFVELGVAPRPSSVLYDRAGSAISRVTPGSIDWGASVFAGARWYHVSGITPALSDGAAEVTAESLAAAKKAGLTVSYDLNYRSKLWSAEQARAVQEPLMEHVDVLITTEEDARVVFGVGAESAESLAKRFELSAVAITSLRESPGAAIVAAEGKVHTAPRYEVDVVDRFGAGDAFCGGLIVSRLENRGWDDAVRFATATSALKHSIPGDFCLVTRAEVDELLRGASLRVSR